MIFVHLPKTAGTSLHADLAAVASKTVSTPFAAFRFAAEDMACVGHTETLPSDLERLKSLLPKLPPVPQLNATAVRRRVAEVDEDVRRRIVELNAYDLELYRFSRTLALER